MARTLKAKVVVTADTKQANAGLKKTQVQMGLLATTTRGLSAAMTGLAAAFTTAAVAGAGIILALVKIVGLANEEEDAVRKLNAAIGNLNGERELLSQRLQDNADALSAVTKLGNEEILAVEATIAVFIKSEAQIIALTKASLDFAEFSKTSAVSAAQLLTRTVVSSTNALVRQGLVVEGAAGSVERFASAIEALAKFEGQAESAAATTSGRIGLLADSFTDALQELGLLGTALEGTKNFLDFLTSALNRAGAAFKFLRVDVGDLALSIQVVAEKVLPGFINRLIGLEGVTKNIIEVNKIRNAILKKEQAALNASAEATDELTKATKESNDALLETEEAVDKTIAALRKLGVVLDEDVNKKLEEQAALLDSVHDAYNRGNLSRDDFERSEIAIAGEVVRLNGTLVDQTDVLVDAAVATDQYSSSLQIATVGLDALSLAEIRNADTTVTSADRRASARLRESNLGTQFIFGQQTTQGGTFFIPDEVVAGTNGRVEILRPGDTRRA